MTASECNILECAKQQGFKLPFFIKVPKTISERGKLPYQIHVWRRTKLSDIKIWRYKPIKGADPEEYCVSYTTSLITFRVTDEQLNQYIKLLRNKVLRKVLK
jgi:hypothetical protein